jgi:hypothetical protein
MLRLVFVMQVETLDMLTDMVPKCSSTLTSLTLDGNSLTTVNVSRLFNHNSLKELSLRFCQLSDFNATLIGNALGIGTDANRYVTTTRSFVKWRTCTPKGGAGEGE